MSEGFVNREAFLGSGKKPRRIRVLDIPDFGKVRVQELSALERGKFEARFSSKKAKSVQSLREQIAIECVVDENNCRMFTDADTDALGQCPAHVLESIVKAYQELNSSDDTDIQSMVGN
jgi:hypothetical protein